MDYCNHILGWITDQSSHPIRDALSNWEPMQDVAHIIMLKQWNIFRYASNQLQWEGRQSVLCKLRSFYSRTSALGPEGHCTSCFQKWCVFYVDDMSTSTWGRRRSISCGRMWTAFLVVVINGWPRRQEKNWRQCDKSYFMSRGTTIVV